MRNGEEREETAWARDSSRVEGGLAAAAALPEIGNARPNDVNGVGPRGERDAALGGRERERSYYGSEDKRKNKWAS